MYIVEKDPKQKKIKAFIYFSAIFILLLLIPFKDQLSKHGTTPFSILFGTLVFIWLGANIYSNFALPPYRKIGTVSFEEDYINILGEKISISDIKLLKIIYIDVYGQSGSPSSLSVLFGDNNIFFLKTKSGKVLRYNILFEKKSQVLNIQRVLKYYYGKGIDVEFYKHNKLIFPRQKEREY